MAQTDSRRLRAGQWLAGPWRIAMPRLLAGGLVLSLPALATLLALFLFGFVEPGPGLVAALVIYVAMVLLLKPLIFGIAAVQVTIEAMAADEHAAPEVDSVAPSVRELSVAVGRLSRSVRQQLRSREAERDAERAVLAALPEPLLLLDPDRRVVRANAAAEALLGDRLVGLDVAATLRHPAVLAATDVALRGGRERVVEFELTSPLERHLSARVAPLWPHTAEGAAAVLVLNDHTAMTRAERQRADFVANASHELRTPLASLVGFIETLRGPARDDKAAGERFLGIMAEQAARMQRLVDDLLSLSRIEMNEHRPPTDAVDLAGVVRGVADALEQRAASRGMRIALALPDDLPPVQGDADELAQVFQNLIDNAIKYGTPGTVIEIGAARSARALPAARPGQRAAVAIAVRDHGAGIEREHLPRLTERFYRVDPARSRELGGTGLGLAIVKHIVSHHRGVLDIHSEPGVGSVFTVQLPC